MSEYRAERKIAGERRVVVCLGDLTREAVDAIVNAANEQLAHGGGLAGAIVRVGGKEIYEESRRLAPVPTGGAVATGAGRLPCRRVIHAVGPVWSSYSPEEADRLLAEAVGSALMIASDEGLGTIALPAISSGIFGFPKERCAEIMIQAIVDFFEHHPDSSLREVRCCNFDEPTVSVFEKALQRREDPPV